MANTKRSPPDRADVRVAGSALIFAMQHDVSARGEKQLALIEKYAPLLGGAVARGVLVAMQAEAYGSFCDHLASGFKAWASGDADGGDTIIAGGLTCPSCEAEMRTDGDEHVCADCGWRERR